MEKTLEVLGFNENEAKVYLATLKLDNSSVQDIAKEAGINRVTCYYVLDKLIEKGAITERVSQKAKRYSAVEIVILFERLKDQFKILEKNLPFIQSLKALYENQPKVNFYREVEGIKVLLEDCLTATNKELLVYADPQEKKDLISYEGKRFNWFYAYKKLEHVPQRVAKEVRVRELTVRNEYAYFAKIRGPKVLRENRFLPKEKFYFNHEVRIYDNKISFIFIKEKNIYGTIIEDAELAKMQRSIFEFLWEISLQFDQSIPKDFDSEKYEREIIKPLQLMK